MWTPAPESKPAVQRSQEKGNKYQLNMNITHADGVDCYPMNTIKHLERSDELSKGFLSFYECFNKYKNAY